MQPRSTKAAIAAAAILVAAIVGACAQQKMETSLRPAGPSPKFYATSYINEGKVFRFLVDVRAARLLGPSEILPLMVVFENKTGKLWTVNRESFILELPDENLLPLMTYEEFEDDYNRERSDLRAAQPFIESLAGRYPQPPFNWLALDFFPVKGTGIFPREEIQTRTGQLVQGYIYFRLPRIPDEQGRFKLLLKPDGQDETFVVDFEPFKETKK